MTFINQLGRTIFVLLFFVGISEVVTAQVPLYVSKQTNEKSSHSGSQSKTTDQFESGSVTISKTGPINYTLSPSSYSIGPNETKTWNGTVFPVISQSPAPGNSANASVMANYDVHYSRPCCGGPGTVTSTYNHGATSDPAAYCNYHGGAAGDHELVHATGTQARDFVVYSIKVEIPDTSNIPESAPGTITATPFPASGGDFLWTTPSNKITLSNTNQQTVTVTIIDPTFTSTTIKVKYTIEGVNYTAQGVVQKGDCNNISGSRSFGPITFTLPGVVNPSGPSNGGYCEYSVSAALTVSMEGVFQRNASLNGVSISWKEKAGNPGDFKDVTVSWSGQKSLPQFGVVTADLTAVSISVNASGNVSGSATFTVNQTQDVNIGYIAVLKQGLSGTFTYNYQAQSDFSGTWDFGGIQNFEVHLVKAGTVIGKITAQSMDANGNITNARFSANAPGTYTTNNFKAKLEQLDLGMNFNIANTSVEFINGIGRVKIYDVTNVTGFFRLNLTFSPTQVTAAVVINNVKAFDCKITGTLSSTIDYNFDVNVVKGNTISAKHDDFDQQITGVSFELLDGELNKFKAGQVSLKYKNKVTFSMLNINYNKPAGQLKFDSEVSLPSLQLDVTDFNISTSGVFTIGNIHGAINRSPVSMNLNVGFSGDEFSGSFNGQFTGNVGIGGSLTVGATNAFNYCHVTFHVSTPGIPIANSGVKVRSLSGEFGYNWNAVASGSGAPSNGAITIGFGLGLGDVGNLTELDGNIQFVMGNNTTVTLDGGVKVLASSPHYLNGNMSISYTLGSTAVNGALSSTIKFPPNNGSVIQLNTGNVNFGINGNSFHVSGSGMNGKIFNEVDVAAGLSVNGPLSNPGGFSGSLNGSLNYQKQFNYRYPPGFNPANCSTADATDNTFGFGVKGSLNITLSGGMNSTVNSSGIVGAVNAQANGTGNVKIKWPCFIVCGSNCVSVYSASVNGNLTLERTSNQTRLYGQVTVTSGSESEQGEIDITL